MNISAEFEPTHFDKEMMQRCLQLAAKASGKTSPNPMVGAVVVREDKIVGEGFHPEVGKPHAEVFALREAGEKARGATIYISLEPCNHYGRTPPCTEALIAAGVSKVIVGMVDPDPRVSGEGIARLREAGIEVVVGVEEEACRQLNEAFIHRILARMPFGILKYAMTLDGKIAATSGHSAWVTTKASRKRVHQLRSTCDAVIIGGNTVRRDNPHLTTHGVSDRFAAEKGAERNPLRVVMTRHLDLPVDCHLWDIDTAPTVIFTQKDSNPQLQQQLRARGVEISELADLTPKIVMKQLYDRGLSKILWECGGTLAAKAISDRVIQKVMAFIAPKIIGGETAPSPVGGLNLTKMTDALQLERINLQSIDSDILVEGYLK